MNSLPGYRRLRGALCTVAACCSMLTASHAATAQATLGGALPDASYRALYPLSTACFGLSTRLVPTMWAFVVGSAMQGDPVTITKGKRDFLEPNRPNPFGITKSFTEIAYAIGEDSHVRLTVYDFFFDKVVTLVDADKNAGRYVVPFNPPATMPSGMYFYELVTGRTRELRRMMYVK